MYIKDNPINADTQIELERFLITYSYLKLENQAVKIAGIDFSTINPKLSKIFIESQKDLIKLINTYVKESKHGDLDVKEYGEILKTVSTETLINIIYVYTLKIISNYNRSIDLKTTTSNLSIEIGGEILNIYYYNKYSIAKKKLLETNPNIGITYSLSN